MTSSPEVQAYVRAVQEDTGLKRTTASLPLVGIPFPARRPRAAWYNYTTRPAAEFDNVDDVLAQAQADRQHERRAVCVIEAVDWEWIGKLGHGWNVDPTFFAGHGTNPEIDEDGDVWSAIFPLYRGGLGRPDVANAKSKSVHADGVFEYRSLSGRDRPLPARTPVAAWEVSFPRVAWIPMRTYPPSCTTRMSYHRVHERLYLILVDPPFSFGYRPTILSDQVLTPTLQAERSDSDLRMCFSGNRGGLSLPQLLDRPGHSLFQVFQNFFEHGWHFNILFADVVGVDSVLAPSAFLHLIASSLWRANFRAVETEIKAISFRELHQPDMATNAKLHLLREKLTSISGGTAQTNRHVPTHVREFYSNIYADSKNTDRLNFQTPMQQLTQLNEEAAELQRFLMDSFQLLISSVSVIETVTSAKLARISFEQASRGAKLTQLAFIYVPLSFVTGIFGMNIKEINDSPLPVSVCFVTLVIVIVATAAIFGGYELFETFQLKRNVPVEEAENLSKAKHNIPVSTMPSNTAANIIRTDGKAGIWSP